MPEPLANAVAILTYEALRQIGIPRPVRGGRDERSIRFYELQQEDRATSTKGRRSS